MTKHPFPLLLAVLLLGGCHNMQLATGDRIVSSGPPGSPTAPIRTDAERQAAYNRSGQSVVPNSAPRTPPLNQQVSEINDRKLPDIPANQSPNITPEQRSQQQIPQPALLPPAGRP